MDTCPNCHRGLEADPPTCPHCGADVAALRSMLQGGTRPERSSPDRSPGGGLVQGKKAQAIVAAGILSAIGVLLLILLWPSKFPDMVLTPAASNPTGEDPCLVKDQCVVLYLAPWCGYCRKAISVAQGMIDKFEGTDTGLKVVVGSGQPDALEAMAEGIGVGTFLDGDRRLWNALGISGVPAWYLVDSHGTIRGQVSGYANMPMILKALGHEPEKI